jgi:hypothetical protein
VKIGQAKESRIIWLKTLAKSIQLFLLLFFAVLGLELRAYTLSHSASPFL